MKSKSKLGTILTVAAIGIVTGASAFAADINARVKTVDAPAHVITVIEGGKLFPFTVTADTKYTDGKDREITFEGDPLASALFKDGTRLSIKYETKDAVQVASIVKLRDYTK